ncbi:MAG: transposase, partial [Dehalococcoidia bacterium]
MFRGLASKPVRAVFDEPDTTSDGGALLLKAADRRLGLTEALAACLEDPRAAHRVAHSLHDLLRQRVYGLALGYEDANDAARIGDDPMHKLLLDRDPLSGEGLASQPTLSRFENGVDRRALVALGERLADTVLDRLKARRKRRPPRLVTIDLDPTCDPTHGRQQLSFFHGFYDTHCYLPMLGFVTLDDECESFLVAAVLRSGRAPDKQGAI